LPWCGDSKVIPGVLEAALVMRQGKDSQGKGKGLPEEVGTLSYFVDL